MHPHVHASNVDNTARRQEELEVLGANEDDIRIPTPQTHLDELGCPCRLDVPNRDDDLVRFLSPAPLCEELAYQEPFSTTGRAEYENHWTLHPSVVPRDDVVQLESTLNIDKVAELSSPIPRGSQESCCAGWADSDGLYVVDVSRSSSAGEVREANDVPNMVTGQILVGDKLRFSTQARAKRREHATETVHNADAAAGIAISCYVTPDSEVPLHIAAHTGRLSLVESLLHAGVSVNTKDGASASALHYAASAGHVDIARQLVARGADVHARDFRQQTPLHYAAEGSCAEVVKILMSGGADPCARDFACDTPLSIALQIRSHDVALAMVEKRPHSLGGGSCGHIAAAH